MRKNLYFICFIMILCVFLMINVSANSAEPPIFIIIAENVPDDFFMSLIIDEKEINGNKRVVAWETYYSFERYKITDVLGEFFDWKTPGKISLKVTASGESFEINISSADALHSYDNIYTLNLNNRTLNPGILLVRSVILVGLRVLLTLIIEGIIFFAFKYRKKRSWVSFFVINLLTQGALNIILNIQANPLTANFYVVFGLFLMEIVITIAEAAAFSFVLSEHKIRHAILYALIANTASFILGGILLSYLPV